MNETAGSPRGGRVPVPRFFVAPVLAALVCGTLFFDVMLIQSLFLRGRFDPGLLWEGLREAPLDWAGTLVPFAFGGAVVGLVLGMPLDALTRRRSVAARRAVLLVVTLVGPPCGPVLSVFAAMASALGVSEVPSGDIAVLGIATVIAAVGVWSFLRGGVSSDGVDPSSGAASPATPVGGGASSNETAALSDGPERGAGPSTGSAEDERRPAGPGAGAG